MHKLHNRLKKLETVIIGEPFFVPIFPPFTLDEIHQTLGSWGISRNRTGHVALMTMGDGAKGMLEFDPKNLDLVEEQLGIINQEYLSNRQNHTPEKVYNL